MARKSIMQDLNEPRCYLCGRNGSGDPLELHHVLGGPNRKHSDEDGLTVLLCGERCHRNGPRSAHRCRETSNMLKADAQRAYEKEIGTREQFMARYGKNYL